MLTPKQERFVQEYLIDLNGTQAAIRAGYSRKTAQEQSSRLLSKAIVAKAVQAGKARQLEKAELTAARTLEELRRGLFFNPRHLFDEHGDLKHPKDWTDEDAAALAGFEVLIKNAKAGDGQTDTIHKVKWLDKGRLFELAMKHLGLLKETIDVKGDVVFTWQR